MKHLVLISLLAVPALAAAQRLPQPSPPAKVEQIIGLTTVQVEYSRPSMKGRPIFGDLVPMGKVWRTGANQCTLLRTDGMMMVEGQKLSAGTYSVLTVPGEESWQVMFNRDTTLWGEDGYKDELNALVVKVMRDKNDRPVETFTIHFGDLKEDQATMFLSWENITVPVVMQADSRAQAITNIQKAIEDPKAGFGTFHSSARFCLDRGLMLKEALGWAQKSVTMEKKFWNLHTLAKLYAANGMYKEAIATAEESMKLSQEAANEGYVKMNKEGIEKWAAMTK